MEHEVFVSVPGFPKYKISNMGNVFSAHSNKLLKPVLDIHNGYYIVTLCQNGKRQNKFIHELVLVAHVGERPSRMTCNHKDGDKSNNTRNNLEWVTQSENVKHAYATGLAHGPAGDINGQSKLTKPQVIKIKNIIKSGSLKGFEIAKMFNVSQATISSIKHKTRWGHV